MTQSCCVFSPIYFPALVLRQQKPPGLLSQNCTPWHPEPGQSQLPGSHPGCTPRGHHGFSTHLSSLLEHGASQPWLGTKPLPSPGANVGHAGLFPCPSLSPAPPSSKPHFSPTASLLQTPSRNAAPEHPRQVTQQHRLHPAQSQALIFQHSNSPTASKRRGRPFPSPPSHPPHLSTWKCGSHFPPLLAGLDLSYLRKGPNVSSQAPSSTNPPATPSSPGCSLWVQMELPASDTSARTKLAVER